MGHQDPPTVRDPPIRACSSAVRGGGPPDPPTARFSESFSLQPRHAGIGWIRGERQTSGHPGGQPKIARYVRDENADILKALRRRPSRTPGSIAISQESILRNYVSLQFPPTSPS